MKALLVRLLRRVADMVPVAVRLKLAAHGWVALAKNRGHWRRLVEVACCIPPQKASRKARERGADATAGRRRRPVRAPAMHTMQASWAALDGNDNNDN